MPSSTVVTAGRNSVRFASKGVTLAGHLFAPPGFDAAKKYEAVVMTPPFPQVKDQTLGNYGPKFAELGYVALCFDYSSKGESESYAPGFRNDENAPRKWEDLRNAVSFLRSQPFVGEINGFSVCGGGNVMSSVLITDLRVKAYASVSAMMASDMMYYGDTEERKKKLKAANAARQKMFETGESVAHDFFGYTDPEFLEKNPAVVGTTVAEGFDYYGTERGGTARYPTYSNVVHSDAEETALLNLGEHYADKILQPYCGIVGSKADTALCTKAFFEKVTAPKEYHEIEGASHVALYDTPAYVEQVAAICDAFYKKHAAAL